MSSFQRVGLDWVLLYTEVLRSEGLTRGTEVSSFQRVGLDWFLLYTEVLISEGLTRVVGSTLILYK